jgi:hypothetical protein
MGSDFQRWTDLWKYGRWNLIPRGQVLSNAGETNCAFVSLRDLFPSMTL